MSKKLEGKIALITGASRGVGAARKVPTRRRMLSKRLNARAER